MSKIVVGLDIGTTKIACFVGRKNEHGKIEILSMGKAESLGVQRGIVTNIDKTVQSIRAAIEETIENIDGDLKIGLVNVGIAGQHIKSVQHRGIYTRTAPDGEISQTDVDALIEDMYKLVMNPGEDIIDVIPQEYIVDKEIGIKDPIGMAGRRLEANFHIITGHTNAVKNINKCIERADLQVKDIILEPIASAEAVLSDEDKEAGVVLVDIGGGTTDLTIFYEGIIRHTAVIPFGGNAVTEDIKEGCGIMRRHAEQLKMKFGSALSSENKDTEVVCIPHLHGREPKEITLKNLSGIIQARMEEIIELVNLEIVNSGFKKKILSGVVITGGGAQLKHLPQLFEYVTGLDSRIGYPNEHLASNPRFEGLTSPMYSTGIGLVLKGFTSADDIKKMTGEKKVPDVLTPPVNHSKKLKGSFFTNIFEKGLNLFTDED
ncbi:MAG: cell division protein FtsA [Bacteroidota bacterium]